MSHFHSTAKVKREKKKIKKGTEGKAAHLWGRSWKPSVGNLRAETGRVTHWQCVLSLALQTMLLYSPLWFLVVTTEPGTAVVLQKIAEESVDACGKLGRC